jgi:hypothetical protein
LQLKTDRRREGYVITASEEVKMARLFANYGIDAESVNFVNSVNSEMDIGAPPDGQQPLII